jgi:hypothetical protein
MSTRSISTSGAIMAAFLVPTGLHTTLTALPTDHATWRQKGADALRAKIGIDVSDKMKGHKAIDGKKFITGLPQMIDTELFASEMGIDATQLRQMKLGALSLYVASLGCNGEFALSDYIHVAPKMADEIMANLQRIGTTASGGDRAAWERLTKSNFCVGGTEHLKRLSIAQGGKTTSKASGKGDEERVEGDD